MFNCKALRKRALAVMIPAVFTISAVSTTALAETKSQAVVEPLSVVVEFLSNTAPDKVEAATQRLVAPDATYVSLNFDNPELKTILPWTGTDTGPQAYSDTFLQVADYWTIEDFTVTDTIASGEDVAVFGRFTYRSVEVGRQVTSPFSIHAKVRDGKIIYFQFMEDTYSTAASFRQSGTWTVKTTKDTDAFSVGEQ